MIQSQQQPTTNSCEIFGIAGILVQLVLGLLSFSVLIIKRYLQFPKRAWKIWALDASKQACSQLIAHFINITISLILSHQLSNDACLWYFITNVLDNTLGVFIIYVILKAVQSLIFKDKCPQFISGNYYDIVEYQDKNPSHLNLGNSDVSQQPIKSLEISMKKRIVIVSYFAWLIQFLIWVLIVSVCKAVVFLLEYWLNSPLNSLSQFLLGWVQPYPTLELTIVIIIIPLFMNGLAFWIMDNFIKKDQSKNSQNSIKQPLI